MRELYHELTQDLKKIGFKLNYTLDLRPYSKNYLGLFDPNTSKIIIYVYKDPKHLQRYSYEEILMTAVHEAVHCKQWSSPSFVRVKGVMHDPQFYELFNKYSNRAKTYLLFKEIKNEKIDTIFKKRSYKTAIAYS